MKKVLIVLALLALITVPVAASSKWTGRMGTGDLSRWEKDTTLSATIWTGRLGTGDLMCFEVDTTLGSGTAQRRKTPDARLCANPQDMVGAEDSGGHHLKVNQNFTLTFAQAGSVPMMISTDEEGHVILWKGCFGNHKTEGHPVPKENITLDAQTGPNGEKWYEGTHGSGCEKSTIKMQFWGDDPQVPDDGGNWVITEHNPDNPDGMDYRSNMSKYNTWK